MPPIASASPRALLCGWLQMRAAVQLAERVQFLRGSVRGSFSAPVFTPFPLRTNVRATEAHLQPWPGGLQVGCGRTVCLAHHSQREIFFCASWPRGYYPSRRERERARPFTFSPTDTPKHLSLDIFGPRIQKKLILSI